MKCPHIVRWSSKWKGVKNSDGFACLFLVGKVMQALDFNAKVEESLFHEQRWKKHIRIVRRTETKKLFLLFEEQGTKVADAYNGIVTYPIDTSIKAKRDN